MWCNDLGRLGRRAYTPCGKCTIGMTAHKLFPFMVPGHWVDRLEAKQRMSNQTQSIQENPRYAHSFSILKDFDYHQTFKYYWPSALEWPSCFISLCKICIPTYLCLLILINIIKIDIHTTDFFSPKQFIEYSIMGYLSTVKSFVLFFRQQKCNMNQMSVAALQNMKLIWLR